MGQMMLSPGRVLIVGERPGLPIGSRDVNEPYIGGEMDASQFLANLPHGAYHAGLIARQGAQFFEVQATGHDPNCPAGWDETGWMLVAIPAPASDAIITNIL